MSRASWHWAHSFVWIKGGLALSKGSITMISVGLRALVAANLFASALLLCGLFLSGCRHPAKPGTATTPVASMPVATASAAMPAGTDPLPLALDREQRTRRLLDSLRKRVLGRRAAAREVERVATEIRPLVEQAAQ